MSLYGMQLPKQLRVQKTLGPVEKNQGGAAIYDSPLHRRSTSFQWSTYFKPRPEHYQKIQAGEGTFFKGQFANTGNCFEFTARNSQHQFHSTGVRQMNFNNQKYNKLTKDSRYREKDKVDEILSPDSPVQRKGYQTVDAGDIDYDIKGNTYKNTLIPEKSAKSAFSRHKGKSLTMYGQGFVDHGPVKPRYKGYIRSGQILFNNINQINTWDQRTPKVTPGARTSLASREKPTHQLFIETQPTSPGTSGGSKSQARLPHTTKHKDHMKKTMNQMINYSPEFKMNKLNNYDNTVFNVSRQIYETCDFTRLFPKDNSRNYEFKSSSEFINNGSQMGAGQRAYLYGSWTKKKSAPNTSIDPTKLNLSNKPLIQEIRNQKHYDSNIKNEIMYQQNLLEQKATELDLRSQGVQKYGYQPLYTKDLENKRNIDGIVLDTMKGKDPSKRLPEYKRKFTPITTYMKKLHDTRITHLYGNKMKP